MADNNVTLRLSVKDETKVAVAKAKADVIAASKIAVEASKQQTAAAKASAAIQVQAAREVGAASRDASRLAQAAARQQLQDSRFAALSAQQAARDTARANQVAARETQQAWASTFNEIKALAIGFLSVQGVIEFSKAVFTATTQTQGLIASLTTSLGSSKLAGEELAFVRAQAERIGVVFSDIAPAYADLAAAASKSNITLSEQREIFIALNEIGAVYKKSSDEIRGALLAVQQVISKGVVSAEELRGQLGERIPGAFSLAAQAIGVTEEKLNDMLKAGELTAKELLPALARELRAVAASGLVLAQNSPSADLARLKNAVNEFLVALGNSGVIDAAAAAMRGITVAFKLAADNIEVFNVAASALAGLLAGRFVASMIAARAAAAATAATTATAAVGITASARAFTLLGGPVGLLIGGLATLPALFAAFSNSTDASAGSLQNLTDRMREFNEARKESERVDTAESLFAAALKERSALLEGLAQQQEQVNSLRESGDRALVRAAQEAQTQIDAQRQKVQELDAQTAQLLVTNDKWFRATAVGFAEVTKNSDLFGNSLAFVVGKFFELTTLKPPAGLADDLKAVGEQLNTAIKSSEESLLRAQGKNPLAERIRALSEEAKKFGGSYGEMIGKLEAGVTTLLNNERATKALTEATKTNRAAARDQKEELAKSVTAFEGLQNIARDLSDQFNGPDRQANERYSDTVAKIGDAYADVIKGMVSAEKRAEALTLAVQALNDADEERLKALIEIEDAQRKLEAEQKKALDTALGYVRYLERLSDLNDLTNEQRQVAEAGLREEARITQLINAANKDKKQISDELARVLREQARAQGEINEQEEISARNRGTFGSYNFGGGTQSLDNFGELLGATLDASFRDGAEGFKAVLEDFQESFAKAVEEKGSVAATADVVTSVANFLGNARDIFRENRDAPLRAIQQVAAQLPGAVGSVARAIGAIDSLFGGRLLGGPKELTGSNTSVNIGAGGVSGQNTQNFQRQRSLFRGRSFTSQTTQLGAELDPFREILDSTRNAVSALARELGQSVPDAITSNFRQTFDKDGKLLTTVATVLGETFNEGAEQFAKRYLAESLIAVFEQAAPGIRALTDGFRIDSQKLLDFAQGLTTISASIKAGSGLLGGAGLLETTAFTQAQQREAETLAETYDRLTQATASLDAAIIISGVNLDLTREEFVRFAAEIADAAGGTQQAAQLWQTYFESFYSETERAQKALEQANLQVTSSLEAAGLAATISAEQFREQFEAALPSLTPEQIVLYLQAGSAIAAAASAQEAYNEALGAGAEEALRALESITAGINAGFVELERQGITQFQRSILQINDSLATTVSALIQQQAAAEAAGASSEELARFDLQLGRAHLLAAAQASAAINQLRRAARSLISQLYGSGVINQLADQGVTAFEQIGDAAQSMYQQQLNNIKAVQDYLDAQLLGSTSTLTPVEQFEAALAQFNAAVGAGNGQEAVRLADILLRLGQARFASSQPYTDLEQAVRAALQGLVGVGTPTAPTGGGGFGSTGSPREFDAPATENRLELARQLSEIVRELLIATGGSLAEISASIGLNVTKLVTDLGVNLGALTVQTTGSLATIANNLGIELGELATNLGVDLGALSTDQSLINAALESAIGSLPKDQADKLQPLLDAVEDAAATGGPDKINSAIDALEDAVAAIGGGTATKLAPFFEGIDPTDPLVNIDTAVRDGLKKSNEFLERIVAAVEPQPIITPPPQQDPQRAQAPVVAELRALGQRLQSLEATVRRGDAENAQATAEGAAKIAAAKAAPAPRPKLVMSET